MPKDNKPRIFEVLDQVKHLKKEVQDVKNDLMIIKDYIKNKEKSKEKEEALKEGWYY